VTEQNIVIFRYAEDSDGFRQFELLREHTNENCFQILVGKSEGKRPLGRPRRRREDNIRMDLSEIV